MTIFGVAGAVTAFGFGLILIEASQIAQREAAMGNTDVVGSFIVIGLLVVLAMHLLALANPAR